MMKKWAFDKPKNYRAEHLQKVEKHQLAQQAETPKREEAPGKQVRRAA
jgi:hypothetical protein